MINSLVIVLLGLTSILLLPADVAAAGAISQGYQTSSTNISKGALLSLVSTNSTKVELANSTSNVSRLVGIAADEPLVVLSEGGERSTQVVMSGQTETLVSNINGDIKSGDKITASPLSGIGMKATDATEVVGTAQADLSSVKTVSKTVTDQNATSKTVKVGLLPVAVNVGHYASSGPQGGLASLVPSFLQSVANTIAGKQVSPLRALLAFAVLIFGFVVVVVMMQSSIRSGIISLGRNPLAQKILRRGLIDVIIAAIGILIITAVSIYALLVF